MLERRPDASTVSWRRLTWVNLDAEGRRAALARALALDPDLVFLDEPTSGLDPIGAADFDELVIKLRDTLGLTVYMVTHDLDSLFTACDRIAVLAEKRVLVTGTMDDMLKQDHPWIREYFHGPRARAATSACSARSTTATATDHQPVSGTLMALATPKLVMTQVPCAGLTPMSPAMAGIDTLAIDESSTFMNVASDSAIVPATRAPPSSGAKATRAGAAAGAGGAGGVSPAVSAGVLTCASSRSPRAWRRTRLAPGRARAHVRGWRR